LENLGIDEDKLDLREYDVKVWINLKWLRVGIIGGEFHKMLLIS
jgi:hypothetical protein